MANVKAAFYQLLKDFKGRAQDVARVATGPSCEQWVNGEIFRLLNWGTPRALKRHELAYGEYRKRDLTIGTVAETTHVIEVKLLYQGFSLKRLRSDKLLVLRRQVDKTLHEKGTTKGKRYVGLVIALWVSRSDASRRKYLKPYDFFAEMSRLLRETFPARAYTTQHDYRFEAFIRPQDVRLGDDLLHVEMRGAYVTKRVLP